MSGAFERAEVRMKLQSAEFDAMEDLAQAWRALRTVAIVDDDYPEVRHRYEGCLTTFLSRCRENGR